MNKKDELKQAFDEMNNQLGGALSILDGKSDVVGRDKALEDLDIIMTRRDTPVALLLAEAGVGKSVLAKRYKYELEKRGSNVHLFNLQIGLLARGGNENLIARMNTLLTQLRNYKELLQKYDENAKVMLFIDEVHTVVSIFGAGSKIGGDLLKDSLAAAEEFVSVIAATTPDEYNAYIASDKPLARRFKPISLDELNAAETLTVLKNWLKSKSKPSEHLEHAISEDALKFIIYANHAYRSDYYEPAKSIDVLASVISTRDVTDKEITEETIARVFEAQFNIDVYFQVDIDEAMEHMRSRVKGQPMALYEMEKMIERLAFKQRDSTKLPRGVMLFAGTTGVGKTELAKATSQAIFGHENLIRMDMADYATKGSGNRFSRIIGQAIKMYPSRVVLLDELEKASDEVLNILLPMFDEGSINYIDKGADGTEVEFTATFRNSIIIATSNAGHKVFNEIDKHDPNKEKITGERLTEEMEMASRSIETAVIDGFEAIGLRPEFLQRFQAIVPFMSLDTQALLGIAHKQLRDLRAWLLDDKNIDIRLPQVRNWQEEYKDLDADAVSMYIVEERMESGSGGNRSGARMISKIINRDIFAKIIHAWRIHPDCRKFNVRTNGMSMFEDKTKASSRGNIIVEPKEGRDKV